MSERHRGEMARQDAKKVRRRVERTPRKHCSEHVLYLYRADRLQLRLTAWNARVVCMANQIKKKKTCSDAALLSDPPTLCIWVKVGNAVVQILFIACLSETQTPLSGSLESQQKNIPWWDLIKSSLHTLSLSLILHHLPFWPRNHSVMCVQVY